MFLSPCHIQGIVTNTKGWLVLREHTSDNSKKCQELITKQLRIFNLVQPLCIYFECLKGLSGGKPQIQEFYMDPRRKIPRREHEKGLEIGGMFFELECLRSVARMFNEIFR